MEQDIDLILLSSVMGRMIEDVVYRQLEDLQRQGTITDEALKWLRSVSSFVDENGNPQQPINFDRIDGDLRVFISLKEQLDRYLGIDMPISSEDEVNSGPSV